MIDKHLHFQPKLSVFSYFVFLRLSIFQIIIDLQKQLNRTLKLTEPLEGVKFEYGYNTEAMTQVVKYWRDTYLAKWPEREALLNSLPQFTTEIQG